LLYSTNPDADRAFLKDVLDLQGVDAGRGWMIYKLPPSEIAVHPAEEPFVMGHADRKLLGAVLYLMCDDVAATIRDVEARGAKCAPVEEARWGHFTTFELPSGACIGLYQPLHPVAI
jgi:predicted enzyme related to lactoylglutathione lyase